MPTVYISQLFPHSDSVVQKIAYQMKSFLNNDSIVIGENCEELNPDELHDKVASCEVLIVVITEEAELKSNNIFSKGIKKDIVIALNFDLMIIPLLFNDAKLPEKENMPGIMGRLLENKFYRLRTVSWIEDIEHLLEEIEEELDFKKDVEEKLSKPVPNNFPIQHGDDESLAEPNRFGLEFSGALETQKTIYRETNNLEKARSNKDRNLEKKALSALGLCFTRLGQVQKAIQYFEEQLEIVREQNDPKELCELLANLGDAFAVSGNVGRARSYYEEQLDIANTRGFLSHVGSSYNGLGFVHVKQNDICKGIECYIKALDVYQELKDHDKALELLVGIGLNYQKIGNLEKTCEYLERALDASKYVENWREEARLLVDLAKIHMQLGNNDQVYAELDRADIYLNGLNESWADSLKLQITHIRETLSRNNY